MFCYKCGKQLEEGTAFCPDCGAAQNKEVVTNTNIPQKDDNTDNALSIIGFVISLISLVFNPFGVVSIIAAVCCGIVTRKARAEGKTANKLANAGVIIAAIGIGWTVFVMLNGGF